MAGVARRSPKRSGAPAEQSRNAAAQSGQVLLDALIAIALLCGAFLAVSGTAHAVARRAEERHSELLRAIEVENALACGHEPSAGR